MALDQGPLDLSWNPNSQGTLAHNLWEQARQDAVNAPPVVNIGASTNAAAGSPSSVVPTAVESGPLAKPVSTGSTTSHDELTATPELGPTRDIGPPTQNTPWIPAYGEPGAAKEPPPAIAPVTTPGATIQEPKPPQTKFQAFLSTMRDIATGRSSKPGTLAGDIRGTVGNIGNTLSNIGMTIGPGGAERALQLRQAEANRAMAHAQMESLNQYRQGTLDVQKQKAETAEEKAGQTALITLTDDEAKLFNMPPGTQLNQAQYGGLKKQLVAGAQKTDLAKLTGQQRMDLQAASSRQKFMAVAGVGLFDTQTQTIIPGTEQGAEVTPEMAAQYRIPPEFIGRHINLQQLAGHERAMVMGSPKYTDSVEWKTDINGTLVPMQKPTLTTPQVPFMQPRPGEAGAPPLNPQAGAPGAPAPWHGAAVGAPGATPIPGAAPTAPRRGGGIGGSIRPGQQGQIQMKPPPMLMATASDGKQVAGTPAELKAAGIDSQTANALPSSEVAKVNTARQITAPGGLYDLAKQDLAKISDADMSVIGSRWQEFRRGIIGKGDPRFTKLFVHVNGLLSTAIAQVHVGANGSVEMMEHFQKMADSTFMDKKTLQAALEGEQEYMNDKAMRLTKAGKGGGTQPPTGGTHQVMNKADGQLHYTNSTGTKDLGLVRK